MGIAEAQRTRSTAHHPLDSFFLVAIRAAIARLKATFVREDGSGIVRTFGVPAQSRYPIITVRIRVSNQRFSTFLEATITSVRRRARDVLGHRVFRRSRSPATRGLPPLRHLPPAATTVASISPARGSSRVEPLSRSPAPASRRAQRSGSRREATNVRVLTQMITATTDCDAGVSDVIVTSNGSQHALPAVHLPDLRSSIAGISRVRGSTAVVTS